MAVYTKYNSIFDYSRNGMPDGHHLITFDTGLQIPVEVINIKETTINATWMYRNVLGSDTPDEEMLIVIANHDLVISIDVNFTPRVRKKAFIIYCNGRLINQGVISMTGRGAIGAGQNIVLFKNPDSTYEVIPANGGDGGDGVESVSGTGSGDNSWRVAGKKGQNGQSRMTGGGGSGSVRTETASRAISVKGGRGTSYSGGSASGGATSALYNHVSGPITGGAPGEYCGSGGAGITSPNTNLTASGGAGNPGGVGSTLGQIKDDEISTASSGTGGTLIIYARQFFNQGSIESNGSDANQNENNSAGGGSGGGSINIFYASLNDNRGPITAKGGRGGLADRGFRGGNGGDGTVTLQQIDFDLRIPDVVNEIKYISKQSLKDILKQYTKNLKTSGIIGSGNTTYCYQDIIKLAEVDSPLIDLKKFYDSDHHKITRVELMVVSIDPANVKSTLSTIDNYEITTLNGDAIDLLMTKRVDLKTIAGTPIDITISECGIVTMQSQIEYKGLNRYYLSNTSDQVIDVRGACSLFLYVDYESCVQSMELKHEINSETSTTILSFEEIKEIRNGLILSSEVLIMNTGTTEGRVLIEEQGIQVTELTITPQSSERYVLPKTKSIKLIGSGNVTVFTYFEYASRSFYQ